jgi:hypothetical protein
MFQSEIMNVGRKVSNTRQIISRSRFNKLAQKEFVNLNMRK